MKRLIGALVVCVILLTGCSSPSYPTLPTETVPEENILTEGVSTEVAAPTENASSENVPVEATPIEEVSEPQEQSYTIKATPKPKAITDTQQPPEDQTWISPGKVHIANFYPGARAEYSITIHNGSDKEADFTVAYRYPDHVGEGYLKPVKEVQDWIIVADATPLLMPRETKDVLVVLEMPKDAEDFAPKWEFWIGVKDATQKGMVQTELACRWLVSMR